MRFYSLPELSQVVSAILQQLNILKHKSSLPSLTGNSGKVLGNNGTIPIWVTPSSSGGSMDAIPINGSTNSVESNGIYDALALKVDKNGSDRLITSAEVTKLSNTSGTNTGDQDISQLSVHTTAIGTLSSLTTTAKSNLVAAINEVNAKPSSGGGTNLGWFDVTAYGANPNDNNDDTAAFQAALDACVAAGGGVVFVPASRNNNGYHYYIKGALRTSSNGVNPNCQIEIPFVAASGSKFITVKILGEYIPSFYTEGVGSVSRTNNGCVLESTIQGTGTTPAVFGTAWATAGVVGLRNYIHVEMENIIVRTSTMSGSTDIAGTMTAINFARLTTFSAKNIKVDISSTLTNSVQPTNNTYGIVMPDVLNKTLLEGQGIVMIEGYRYGIEMGEHANFQHLEIAGCVYGVCIGEGDHSVSIQHLTAEVNMNNILMHGTASSAGRDLMPLTILNYETEHAYAAQGITQWYQFNADIIRTTGNGNVNIFNCSTGKSGIGRFDEFIVSGSPNYTIFNGVGKNVGYTIVGSSFPLTNLKGYWDLNTTSWLDTSGNSNALTAFNSPTNGTGKVGNAALFGGSGASLRGLSSNALYSATTSLSVGGWFKVTSSSNGTQFLVSKYIDGGNVEWFLYWNTTSGINGFVHFGVSTNGTTGSADVLTPMIADGTWHHIVGVWTGTGLIVYIDGVPSTTTSGSTSSVSSVKSNGTAPIAVGSDGVSSTASSLIGGADEVFIYQTALSQGDISYLYNSGVGRAKP